MLEKLNSYAVFDGYGTLCEGAASGIENIPLREVVAKIRAFPDGSFTRAEFLPVDDGIRGKLLSTFGTEYAGVEDSYVVDTSADVIKVYSDTMAGLMAGANTLLAQARFNENRIPKGLIYNIPLCPFRSLKVYMPAPDDLDSFYRTVDLLAYLRCNKVIIEVGGAMEYRRHPEINEAWIEYCKEMNRYPNRAYEIQGETYPWEKDSIHFENGGGRFLTQDTVRELIKYCTDRGFEVIPEMPTLSHSDYILMPHKEFAERQDDDWPDTYCPSNPAVYDLVFDLFDEVIDVFQPKIMHIGHDEYYSIGICDRCRGKTGEEIFAGDVTKLHDYLAKRGIRTMFWADKLLPAVSHCGEKFGGSAITETNPDGTETVIRPATYKAADMVPKDVIAYHWYHGIREEYDEVYLKRGIELLYGNFETHTFRNWNRRRKAGAKGGGPSHWSSLESYTLQRNGVYLDLLFGTLFFWHPDYDDEKYGAYLDACFEELYCWLNHETLEKPHFEITHTADIMRKYVYISSLPMQLEKDTIGKYVVRYEDGTTLDIPVIYGLNISNKNRSWERRERGWGAAEREAWYLDQLLVEPGGTALPLRDGSDTVFKIVVENPWPEKKIAGVDVIKTCGDEGGIILKEFKTVNC